MLCVHMENGAPSVSNARDCDVIVIGGGPAGSTAAAGSRAPATASCCSSAIGFPDSTSASRCWRRSMTCWPRLGRTRLVREAGFPQKWGATFMTADGRTERYADFSDRAGRAAHRRRGRCRARRSTTCCCATPRAAAPTCARSTASLDVAIDDRGGDGARCSGRRRHGDPLRHPCAGVVIDAVRARCGCSRAQFDLRIDEPRLANVACSRTTPACRAARAAARATSAIVARDDWAGSG